MRPITRSSSGASSGTATAGPKSPPLSCPEPANCATKVCTASSCGDSHVYACPVARATSQPWMTTSSKATRPATSPGRSTPPALVIPDHAAGSRHAAASAARSRGMRVRQSAPRRDASPDGPWAPASPIAFVAAAVNASARPPTWSTRSPTRYSGHGVGSVEQLLRHAFDQRSHPSGRGFQIHRHQRSSMSRVCRLVRKETHSIDRTHRCRPERRSARPSRRWPCSLLPARAFVGGEHEEETHGQRTLSTRRRAAPPARGLSRIHRGREGDGVLSRHGGRASAVRLERRAGAFDPKPAELVDDALEVSDPLDDVVTPDE